MRIVVLPAVAILSMTHAAVAQTSPSGADGPWSGQAQCVLSAEGRTADGAYAYTR